MIKEYVPPLFQGFARIIRLYHLTMAHDELYTCLNILHAQTGMSPTKSDLRSVIKALNSQPRTLKQMARVVIYSCIDRRPAIYASKLPLPSALKDYVLNFEP